MIWYHLRSTNSSVSTVQWGLSTDFPAPGDYDGDGKFDFAVQRPGATAGAQGVFYIFRSSDLGASIVPFGLSNDLVVPGDYDGDNKTDIAVVREGSTPTAPLVWYILRSSDGGLTAVGFGDTVTDITAQNDYDGDGKADLAIWRNSTGQFWVLQSTNGVYTAVQWGLPNDFPVAGYDTH